MDSPQTLLDQIHATGIYSLDASQLTETEDRVQQAKLLRPKIQAIRNQIKAAKKALNPQQGNAASNQWVLYDYLEEILDKLEFALREFVTDPTVRMPVYGTVFFGNFEQGEWYLGYPKQAQIWKLEGQEKVLAEQIARLEPLQEDTAKKLKTARRTFNEHGGIVRRLFGVVLGLVLIGVGIAITLKTASTLWLIMSGVGVLLLLVGGLLSLVWNRKHHQLRSQSRQLQAQNEKLEQQLEVLDHQRARVVSKLSQLYKSQPDALDDAPPTHMHF